MVSQSCDSKRPAFQDGAGATLWCTHLVRMLHRRRRASGSRSSPRLQVFNLKQKLLQPAAAGAKASDRQGCRCRDGSRCKRQAPFVSMHLALPVGRKGLCAHASSACSCATDNVSHCLVEYTKHRGLHVPSFLQRAFNMCWPSRRRDLKIQAPRGHPRHAPLLQACPAKLGLANQVHAPPGLRHIARQILH